MVARERFICIYTLVSGIILLLGSLSDPPQGTLRILLHIVIPALLVVFSAWYLITGRAR